MPAVPAAGNVWITVGHGDQAPMDPHTGVKPLRDRSSSVTFMVCGAVHQIGSEYDLSGHSESRCCLMPLGWGGTNRPDHLNRRGVANDAPFLFLLSLKESKKPIHQHQKNGTHK